MLSLWLNCVQSMNLFAFYFQQFVCNVFSLRGGEMSDGLIHDCDITRLNGLNESNTLIL